MATTKPKLITAEKLLELYGKGVRGELIRGVLCKKMASGVEHGKTVVNFVTEMRTFIKPRKLGVLMASDAGVRLERDPDTVREPDIAYFSVENMPLDAKITGYAEAAPDLVVEVTSPSNTRWEVNDKALMWLHYGVRLVWVAHPDTRTVEVHREGHRVLSLSDEDTLDGLDVLPGFSCAVSEIFDT